MPARRYRVTIGGRALQVEVRGSGCASEMLIDERPYAAELLAARADGLSRLRVGERMYDFLMAPGQGHCLLAIEGVTLDVLVEDERAARLAPFVRRATRASGLEAITAPMPGLVLRVCVEPGQHVGSGQSLVVLRAMKMENELGSPREGTVKAVNVAAGQAVDQGQLLVELESPRES
jgi:biotin carboxyl carrier protein